MSLLKALASFNGSADCSSLIAICSPTLIQPATRERPKRR
jgi:hypothetical protein